MLIILPNIICLLAVFNLIFRILSKFQVKNIKKYLKRYCYYTLVTYCGLFFNKPFYLSYNPKVLKKTKTICISNHCTDYDWLFILIIFFHLGKYDDLYILLKEGLTKLPLLGYILKQHDHINITRTNKTKDIQKLNLTAKNCNKLNTPWSLFIFPEGTYPHTDSLKSAQKYATKQRIELFRNVLFPRKTGFEYLTTLTNFESIIDITILNNPYHSVLAEEQTHFEYLFQEKIPFSPIFVMNYYDNSSVNPEFLDQSFSEKDKFIESYKEVVGTDYLDDLYKVKRVLKKVMPSNENKLIKLGVKTQYSIIIWILSPMGLILLYLLKKWASRNI